MSLSDTPSPDAPSSETALLDAPSSAAGRPERPGVDTGPSEKPLPDPLKVPDKVTVSDRLLADALSPDKRVLIVDDDRVMQEMLSDYLSMENLEVHLSPRGVDLVAHARELDARVIIADLVMPGMGGLDVLERLARGPSHTEVIIVTSYGTVESAVRALRLGAFDYLQKPVSPEALRASVLRALEAQRLVRAHASLARHVELRESCQRILHTNDRGRLIEEAVSALCAVTGTKAGLCVTWEWGKREHQVAATGLSEEAAAALAGRIEETILRGNPERAIVVEGEGAPPMLLVPVSRGDVSAALVAVNPGPAGFTSAHAEDASFLGEHVSFALLATQRQGESHAHAFVDELTGLYNARYFDVVVARELSLASVAGQAPRSFSVLLLNIDHLRQVNDRFGHLTGSKVLVEMGRVLRRCVREVDPVFRYGGDEYAVLLRGADKQGALHVADRIRKSVEAHPYLAREGLDLRLTASLGIATFPEHATSKDALIDLADRALLAGKQGGRNAVHVATELPS